MHGLTNSKLSLIRNNVTSIIFSTPLVRTTGSLSSRKIVNRIPEPICQSCFFFYFPRPYFPVRSFGHNRFHFNLKAFLLRKLCIKGIGTATVQPDGLIRMYTLLSFTECKQYPSLDTQYLQTKTTPSPAVYRNSC